MKDPYIFNRIMLDNGLTLMLNRLSYASKVCVEVIVNVGGRDGKSGLTHFVEHCLSMAPGSFRNSHEIYQLARRNGGRVELGATNRTHTYFTGYMPIGKESVLFDIFHQVLSQPLFARGLIENERNVILNEISSAVYSEQVEYQEMLLRLACFSEATREIVRQMVSRICLLGSSDEARSITREDIIQHYRSYYRPSRITVFVVGDFEEDAIIQLAKRFPCFPANHLDDTLPDMRITGDLLPVFPDIQTQTRSSMEIFKTEKPLIDFSMVELRAFVPPEYQYYSYIFGTIFRDLVIEVTRNRRGQTYSPSYDAIEYDDAIHLHVNVKTTGNLEDLLADMEEAYEIAASDESRFEAERFNRLQYGLTFNESAGEILKQSRDEFMDKGRVISLGEERQSYQQLTFGEYQRYAELLRQAYHRFIMIP
jgi:predicted Zn-dependent peptidase